jgi:hypothetical protein
MRACGSPVFGSEGLIEMSTSQHSQLHIIYRSVGGDHRKGRPLYFSKMLCLRSMLRSISRMEDRPQITFVNDGPMPEDRLEVMGRWGEVVSLPGLGNSPSYREALKMATAVSEPLMYMAEDDYLYTEDAFPKMMRAFEELPDVDYITLFDHLDRYRRRDDARRGYSRLLLAAGHHWRTIDSTCMTFGARVAALRSDAWIHWIGTTRRITTVPKDMPRDRTIWRITQGQKGFLWKFPKRTLIGPVPSLAAHMDPQAMAPNVDWEQVAGEVEEWREL